MARLSLALLGPLQMMLDGAPITAFESEKVRALLVYLAVETEHPHRRDALAGLLWPDRPERAAHLNLNQALANLRGAIGDRIATPPFLHITRETVQFNRASDYQLDVEIFRAALAACDQHPHRHPETCKSCVQRLQQAIVLYRGGFLAQFFLNDSAAFEEWALLKRERLQRRALRALARLADYHERRGDYEQAQHYIWQQLELDAWREESHRQLMRVLILSGQRSAALAQYERCRRALADELGVEPEAQTTALYEEIRDRETRRPGDKETHAQESGQPFSLSPHLLSSTVLRHDFPAQTSLLIGREAELAELGALLENPAHRLITIVGPGGIGKTRLALAAAAEQAEAFTHGAAFVALAAISSAEFLAPAVLDALDVKLQGQYGPREQLFEYLHAKELLLVLDNVEQLLGPGSSQDEDVASLLSDMLRHAPAVTLLVTSRERLALPDEWLFDLAGLSYPPGDSINGIEGYSAVQLFVQRAGQVRRHFVLAEGEACAVARICRLVEGLPLAIELAAPALRTRSCMAIASAIETSIMALATGTRAIPERQRSMWATFEHSWRLLSDEEHQVFARLSVFRGGFEEDAAVEVAQASPELLASLIDKSLLRWDGVARYDMHELVRQYASEKLEQAGEAELLLRRHAEYYLALAEIGEADLWAQKRAAEWLTRLATEHDNFRASLAWSQARPGERALGLQLAGALGHYWRYRSHIREGSNWIAGLLAHEAAEVAAAPRKISTPVALRARAKALRTAGDLAEQWGALAQARAFLEESIELFQSLGQPLDAAMSQWYLAHLACTQGAHARATELCEESLRAHRAAADMPGVVWCLWLLSNIAREQGDLARAQTLADTAQAHAEELRLPVLNGYALLSSSRVRLAIGDIASARTAAEKALALAQQLGHTTFIPHVLLQLGRVAEAEGDEILAVALWEQALDIVREIQHLRAMAELLLELGWAEHQQGNERRAMALLVESLQLYRARGHPAFIAECLAGIAGVVQAIMPTSAETYRAARLYGVADAIGGAGNGMLRPSERTAYRCDVAAVRAQFDDATFAAAWAEGRAMTLEQAVAYALEVSAVDAEQLAPASLTAKQSG